MLVSETILNSLAVNAVGDQGFLALATHVRDNGTAGLIEMTDLEYADRLHRTRRGILGSFHSQELVTTVGGPGIRMTTSLASYGLWCLCYHNPDTFQTRDGKPMEVGDLPRRVKHYRKTLSTSDGGVTTSSGEAMMQPRFVARPLEGAEELGVHTYIDTFGFLGRNVTEAVLDNIDLVLLNVKTGIPELCKKVTSGDLQPAIDFGDRLAEHGIETWIRLVLVSRLTDSEENIEAMARVVKKWSNVSHVGVLPSHQMGCGKQRTLGLKYELNNTQPSDKGLIGYTHEIFRSHDLTVC